jgi:hypothetical protein
MSEHLSGLETVCIHIDDILHISKGSFKEHLKVLDEVFACLQQSGLKVNATKSNFRQHKLDYLGYHITPTGITLIGKKVQGIQKYSRTQHRQRTT